MRLITDAEAGRALSMTEAVDSVERAFVDHGRGDAVDVPRSRARSPLGTVNSLIGVAPRAGVAGCKLYYATPQGSRSHLVLYAAQSGAPLALIEANVFNVLRTGAACGVATRHLARADATVLGQIGAGRIGGGLLEGVCAVRPIRRVQVYARRPGPLAAFCAEMAGRLGIEVLPAESAQAAVSGADVINVVTKSATPVLEAAWLAPGQHINAAGANQLSRRELDAGCISRCDLVVVDARATARLECGDLLPLVEAGQIDWDRLPELGEVLNGLRPGRTGSAGITLYESHGMALQDLYLAAALLPRLGIPL